MKKGMTIAEVIFMLLILSVIIMCSIPIWKSSLGDLRKKQYAAAYKIAKDVAEDSILDYSVFNTGLLVNSSKEFCNAFADRVNLIGSISGNCTSSSVPSTPNFITTNGMSWYGFNSDFSSNEISVQVDVDGPNKGSNTVGEDILNIIVKDDATVLAPSGAECDYLDGTAGTEPCE